MPRTWLRGLTDLALPVACAGCGTPGEALCPTCRTDIEAVVHPGGPRRALPTPVPRGLPTVSATAAYEGALARVLVAYKDGERRDCAVLLGGLLGRAVEHAVAGDPGGSRRLGRGDGPVLLVPVPSSRRAARSRGDAPLVGLARQAARGFGPHEVLVAPALRQRRAVADQAGLGAAARAVNLDQALLVRDRWLPVVRGAHCLLVDDVLTTGATLAEAARALRRAGAAGVVAAVVAATRRRSPGPEQGRVRSG